MITTPVFQIFDFLGWGALQHLTNRLRAPGGVFGQAAGEKSKAGGICARSVKRARSIVEDGLAEAPLIVAQKGRPARYHLVHTRPKPKMSVRVSFARFSICAGAIWAKVLTDVLALRASFARASLAYRNSVCRSPFTR